MPKKDNKKQNPGDSYTNNHQKKYIAWNYDYKLVCVDDKFSKPFKLCLLEDAAYNFINNIIKESKYCSDVVEEHFHKELVMTKNRMKILRAVLNVGFMIIIMLVVMLR